MDERDADVIVYEQNIENKFGQKWKFQTTAKITPKMFTLIDGDKTITFEKRSNHTLSIRTKRTVHVTERCSLGHDHVKSKEQKEYEFFHLDDAHISQVAEWLNHGTWSEISGEKAPWRKLLNEVYEFLGEVAKRDNFLAPMTTKLRLKIKNILPSHGIKNEDSTCK